MNKKELLEKRAKLIADARALLAKAVLTDEDQANADAMMDEADGIKAQLDRLDRAERLANTLEQGGETPRAQRRAPTNILEHTNEVRAQLSSDEYRNDFWTMARTAPNQFHGAAAERLQYVNSLHTVTDTRGGYLVPVEYETTLLRALDNETVFRSMADVITSGTDRIIPTEVDIGEANWLGEEEEYPESDAQFGRTNMGNHKLGRIIKVSEELLQDAFFDIEGYVANAFGRSFGFAQERAFLTGNGVGKPKGVLLDATIGKTTAAPTALVADDLLDVYHALRRGYRNKAKWLVSDSLIKSVRKLKDGQGNYIWQPGLTAGAPDTMLGRPVEVSDFMPDVAAGQTPLLFGDFKYYRIMDRKGVTMQRLSELYAKNGQVGFRMYMRTDGKLLLPEAVKSLKMAA